MQFYQSLSIYVSMIITSGDDDDMFTPRWIAFGWRIYCLCSSLFRFSARILWFYRF